MDIKDRFTGCLVGLACGDYLGLPYQFRSPESIDFPATASSTGYYSDDTCQTICLAESLLTGFDPRDQFRRYKKWLMEGYATPDGTKATDVGQRTFIALTRQDANHLPDRLEDHPDQGGNGSLMRCTPIGLRYHRESLKITEYSLKSSIITHNNTMAAWSCVVLNLLIAQILSGITRSKLLNKLKKSLPADCPDQIWKVVDKAIKETEFPNTGYCLNTLRIAFHSFFTTKNYTDCITQAIRIGGDTDTQAAVAGAIAGAYYGYFGIPWEWKNNLMRRDYLENLALQLLLSQS